MKKTKLEMVREWRKAFALPTSDGPVVLTEQQLILHTKLLVEESLECLDATTRLKLRDFVADMQYYILCLAVEAGISQWQMDEDFAEVHRSNMSKMWTSKECATIKNKSELSIMRAGDEERCYIVKNSDGKIVKSPSYERVHLL